MMDKGAMTTQTPRFRGWRCKWCRNLEDEEEKKGLVGHPGTRQGGSAGVLPVSGEGREAVGSKRAGLGIRRTPESSKAATVGSTAVPAALWRGRSSTEGTLPAR